jgi:putative phage-type endonuclease
VKEESQEEFALARRSGIGGSDVAAVLGLSKWKTPYDLYLEKTGVTIEDSSKAELFHFGHVLEDVIAQEFSRRNSMKVQRRNTMFRHPLHPELIGNIDRRVVGGGVLECKTADKYTAQLWDDDGGDKIPPYYLCQVMHYLHVTGSKYGWLAVLIGGNEYRQYKIDYDKELAELMAAKCVEFWRNHVLTGIAPEPVTAADLAKMYRSVEGKVIKADEHIQAACEVLRTMKDQQKAVESSIEDYEIQIKKFMTDSEILLDDSGNKLATWKSGTRNSIDTKALKSMMPDIAEQFTRVSETRTFLLK